MSEPRVEMLEVLRAARRSASDLRKVLLAIAAGRSVLFGDFAGELSKTFLRPVLAGGGFFKEALAQGRPGLVVAVLFAFWLAWILVGSFFGLAITRMAAVEITGQRRADVVEARRFARSHASSSSVQR